MLKSLKDRINKLHTQLTPSTDLSEPPKNLDLIGKIEWSLSRLKEAEKMRDKEFYMAFIGDCLYPREEARS